MTNKERAQKVKIILMDVDGTLTDGTLLILPDGEELKTYNVRDGTGILLAHLAGLKTGIITGKASRSLEKRAGKLRIDELHQGMNDALRVYHDFYVVEWDSEQIVSFDDFEPFVDQGCGVDGDALAHRPGRVGERLLGRDVLQLGTAPAAERAAAGGQHELLDRPRALAVEQLVQRGVLGVDRDDPRAEERRAVLRHRFGGAGDLPRRQRRPRGRGRRRHRLLAVPRAEAPAVQRGLDPGPRRHVPRSDHPVDAELHRRELRSAGSPIRLGDQRPRRELISPRAGSPAGSGT